MPDPPAPPAEPKVRSWETTRRGFVALEQQSYTVEVAFSVVLERDAETGDYSAVCPELPGCASAGETEEEAAENIQEAIELCLVPGESAP